MDRIKRVKQVIQLGAVVATFLLTTCRVVKAVELFKECLILLNDKALEKAVEFVSLLNNFLYYKLFMGYTLTSDHTSAIECTRTVNVLLSKSGERGQEGVVSFQLAQLYVSQSEYERAKELFMKALCITIETGDINGEALSHENLGVVLSTVGEYV